MTQHPLHYDSAPATTHRILRWSGVQSAYTVVLGEEDWAWGLGTQWSLELLFLVKQTA